MSEYVATLELKIPSVLEFIQGKRFHFFLLNLNKHTNFFTVVPEGNVHWLFCRRPPSQGQLPRCSVLLGSVCLLNETQKCGIASRLLLRIHRILL